LNRELAVPHTGVLPIELYPPIYCYINNPYLYYALLRSIKIIRVKLIFKGYARADYLNKNSVLYYCFFIFYNFLDKKKDLFFSLAGGISLQKNLSKNFYGWEG